MWKNSSVEVAELFFLKKTKLRPPPTAERAHTLQATRPAWLARLGLLGLLRQNAWATLTAIQIIYSIIYLRVIISYQLYATAKRLYIGRLFFNAIPQDF